MTTTRTVSFVLERRLLTVARDNFAIFRQLQALKAGIKDVGLLDRGAFVSLKTASTRMAMLDETELVIQFNKRISLEQHDRYYITDYATLWPDVTADTYPYIHQWEVLRLIYA